MNRRMLVFDLETNGLLDKMTTVHCAVAKDYKTGEVFKFGPDQIEDFIGLIDEQVLIGHNIINFDLPALDLWASLNEWTDISLLLPNPHMVIDTLVLSRLLNPDRVRPKGLPQRVGPHSLEAWGHRLGHHKGDYGKQEDAWSEYNEQMMQYCVQDTEVTEQVYKHLLKEMDN